MSFKFEVGQEVSFQDPRSKETRFTIIRQMPAEDSNSELRYKIKADGEGFERVVVESDLNSVFTDSQTRKIISKKMAAAFRRK